MILHNSLWLISLNSVKPQSYTVNTDRLDGNYEHHVCINILTDSVLSVSSLLLYALIKCHEMESMLNPVYTHINTKMLLQHFYTGKICQTSSTITHIYTTVSVGGLFENGPNRHKY